MQRTFDKIENGDIVTQDGLMMCRVVEANVEKRGRDGIKIVGVDSEDDEPTFQTEGQVNARWSLKENDTSLPTPLVPTHKDAAAQCDDCGDLVEPHEVDLHPCV